MTCALGVRGSQSTRAHLWRMTTVLRMRAALIIGVIARSSYLSSGLPPGHPSSVDCPFLPLSSLFVAMFSWFWDALSYLGLYYKNAKILFLGLDNAGKTTLMHVLRDDRVALHIPTQQPTAEEVVVGNIRFRAFDLGGHAAARQIWRNYYAKVDGVVFLVDAVDRERFPEVKKELDGLINDDMLSDVPFLILGNKIDMPRAASDEELRSALGLHHLTTGQGSAPMADIRPIELFMCSVVRKMGYAEGFRWLSSHIQ